MYDNLRKLCKYDIILMIAICYNIEAERQGGIIFMWFKRNWRGLLIAVVLTITTTTFLIINWWSAKKIDTEKVQNQAKTDVAEVNAVVENDVIEVETTVATTEATIEEKEPEVLEEEKQEFFDNEIVYDIEYVNDGEVMSYALFTPSTANEDTAMPVIVWLHGLGQVGSSEKSFMNYGLIKIIPDWELTNFNAYIICPHLKSTYNTSYWSNKKTERNLKELLDKFFEEHNIDKDNVIVTGTSLGGQGTIYCAVNMAEDGNGRSDVVEWMFPNLSENS